MQLSFLKALVAISATISCSSAIKLDVSNEGSLKQAAANAAFGLMSYYKNNQSSTPATDFGTFFGLPGEKIYWWLAGAVWGGMIDYTMYTGDQSYVKTTQDAIMHNVGGNSDFLLESKKGEEGNDDQAFWALSVMSAAEHGFPQPQGKALWIDIGKNAFNNMITRWMTDACNGGLKWQIYAENSYGYNYRNSVSNGGLFQLAARLARFTGNTTYIEWAEKVYDWSTGVGFVSDKFEVFDGAGDDKGQNCTKIDKNTWTYNHAIYTYGAAAMYAATNDNKWKDRVNGFVKQAEVFFNFNQNVTDVMSEIVCEQAGKCNKDQVSFKAYLARWLAKTTILAPFTADTINKYLKSTAEAAAQSCTGGSGSECGTKWYVGGYDGEGGVGQQLSALEVFDSLLVKQAGSPKKEGDKPASSSSAAPSSTSAPAASSSPAASSASVVGSSSAAAPVNSTPSPAPQPTSTPAGSPSPSPAPVPSGGTSPSPSPAPAPSAATSAKAESSPPPAAPSAASSSKAPGEFPEGAASTCTPHIATVTVTVPANPPAIPSAPGSTLTSVASPPASKPSSPASVTSTGAVGISSVPKVTPTPAFPTGGSNATSLIVDTGSPTLPGTVSIPVGTGKPPGPQTPTSSLPANFTGAASRNVGRGAAAGFVGAMIGAVALM